jgi:hypothetical protein
VKVEREVLSFWHSLVVMSAFEELSEFAQTVRLLMFLLMSRQRGRLDWDAVDENTRVAVVTQVSVFIVRNGRSLFVSSRSGFACGHQNGDSDA